MTMALYAINKQHS